MYKGIDSNFQLKISLLYYTVYLLDFCQMVKNDFEEVALSAATMPSSPTHLSPYLRFGCLSPRVMWHRVMDCYEKVGISIKGSK